jgi:flavin reductase (DIM6/NTAB) family NADH-FMN oxidoreductase RutF
VGIVSGRDHDKFKETGLTPVTSEKVKAPLALELPFSLECRLVQHHRLGLHTIFIRQTRRFLAPGECRISRRPRQSYGAEWGATITSPSAKSSGRPSRQARTSDRAFVPSPSLLAEQTDPNGQARTTKSA